MKCQDLPPALAARYVGDPIDAVTGEFFDSVQDFKVDSAMPICWHRTYSTSRINEDRGLGRGHSHFFDQRLRLDLDGIRYTSHQREVVDFPSMHADVARVSKIGYILTRVGNRLHLRRPDGDVFVFEIGVSRDARLVQVSNANGSSFVSYDHGGRLASLTDVAGNVVAFTWDACHIVSARVLPRGSTTPIQLVRYAYEGDLLVELEDAYRGRVKLAYDDAGRLVRRTSRKDYSFHFAYDVEGRCVHSAGDDGVLEVRLEFLPLEYRTKVTKSDGGVWEYHYDASNFLTKVIDPDGITRTFVPRPEDGQVALEIDGAGNEIAYIYDADGLCIGRRDAAGRAIRARPLHAIPRTPAEYELGRFVRIPSEIPTLERVHRSQRPSTLAALVLAKAPGAGRTRKVHNIQGLLIREERDDLTRRYAYDQGGNLRWKIDFNGARTEWVHASDDHRISKTDPNGFVTHLEYTKESQLAAVTDAHKTRTIYVRDKRGAIGGLSRANVWKEGYKRDGAGRLVDKTAANGASLFTTTRGPQGEVLERVFASGGFERFVYDKTLRVVAAETTAGAQSFAYAPEGQRIADLREEKGVRRVFVDGDIVEYRVLDAFVTKYLYLESSQGREVFITDPTGRRHRLSDSGAGIVTREISSGRRETAQYHPDGRCLVKVLEPVHATTAAESWVRRFDYSGEGDLLARHDSVRGTTRYAIDATRKLVREELPDGQTRAYVHDAAGNLLEHAGRLATYHAGNVLADAGVRRYEHDLRQAVSSEAWQGGFRRFHRDERDQLVRIETYRASPGGPNAGWEPLPAWTARYDALNRRVEKTFAAQTTTFYWDGDRLAAEVFPTGALRVYIYADALAMTPLLFVDYASVAAPADTGVVYAVFADHLGCPERIEDMDGRTVWAAIIAPYGAAEIVVGGDFHQPLRWPGHYYDSEIGLQYNRFRTYSPELGRYLEPDPLGRGGGLENVYAYTRNPLFRVDIDGLCDHPNDDPNEEKEGNPALPPEEPDAPAEAPVEPPPPPGRTAAARAACQKVLDVMAAMGLSTDKRRVVTANVHQDDSVSVGISGSDSKGNADVAGRVETQLNKGSPPTYRVARQSMPTDNLEAVPGSPNPPGQCAEPHAAQASHGEGAENPVVGTDTRWRGTGENPYPYSGENADGAPVHPSQMDPCPTCADPHNAQAYGDYANGGN